MDDNPSARISRTYIDLAGKKVCKTCDFCVKPNMWQHTGWECKAPQNVVTGIVNSVSGDWSYYKLLCTDAMLYHDNACSWYQIDPYISINGMRQVDRNRMLTKSTERVSIKNLTLDDIL